MLRGFAKRITLAGLLSFGAIAQADAPVRLPPGTRAEADHYVSGRGLRDTTDAIAKELERRGIAVEQVGPSAVRGVELTRFISRADATPWLAIHVMRTAGKTLIFFVARPSS